MRLLAAVLIALGLARPLWAEVPRVATDILPVQALVSRVMDGVGTADLILPPNASPHGHALRPSEARSLTQAQLVVWVGPALTPWLDSSIETLAPEAVHLTLMTVDDSILMPFREGAAFGAHDHGDDHGHDDDHAHNGEDGHDDEHGQDDDHGHDSKADHAEEHTDAYDPHVWLDPRNGAVWLDAIAQALAALDPANAAAYRANAAAGQAELAALETELRAKLDPVRDRPFIVFHDAFHYFEARFGVEATAAISAGDAAKPGAARIATLRGHIAESGAVCAFAEPQFNPGLLATVTEGHSVRPGVLDPMGATIAMGRDHYAATLRAVAQGMVDCLNP